MWNSRFWTARYWDARYWLASGADVADSTFRILLMVADVDQQLRVSDANADLLVADVDPLLKLWIEEV